MIIIEGILLVFGRVSVIVLYFGLRFIYWSLITNQGVVLCKLLFFFSCSILFLVLLIIFAYKFDLIGCSFACDIDVQIHLF